MDETILYLTEIYRANETNDIESRLKYFDILTNSLFTLAQSLFDNKVQIEHHHSEIENKFFRYGMANHSIKKLLNGNQFFLLNEQMKITDLFSVFTLTRMQIESFSIMYYLFFDKKMETIEKDFRYDIYKLHGLQKQNKFPVRFKQNEHKKKEIESAISILEEKIKGSQIFQNANEKQQKKYLNPSHAKLESTNEIFIKSGIDSTRINDIWNLYSNHAHGEHISDRQYNYLYNNTKLILQESMTVLTINTILTSTLCKLISDEFDGVKKKYDELPSIDKIQIEFWSDLKK